MPDIPNDSIIPKTKRQKKPEGRTDNRCPLTKKNKKILRSLSNNQGSLVWRLNAVQIEYITKHFPHLSVKPHIYSVKTLKKLPHFTSKEKQPAILKKLVRSGRFGKSHINALLKKSDIDILNLYEIPYTPVKYLITLR